MHRSTERILSTHVGSLARPHELLDTLAAREHGEDYDPAKLESQVREAVAGVVEKQAEVGLDVLTDGEMSKVSFATYVKDRLAGFTAEGGESVLPASWQVEIDAFPDYYRSYLGKYSKTVAPMRTITCIGPITYTGYDAVATDIANLKAALGQVEHVEAFLPSTSPRGFGRNAYYATETEYLTAVAEALREEYLAITGAGLLCQIDDPWLIEILSDPTAEPPERDRAAREHVEVLNHALRGIPRERVRLHTCYGLNHGPRVHDIPLSTVAPYMLSVHAGAYSFEVANPRHQHEWKLWRDIAPPEGAVLLPGLIGHATNYVEHPELIADQIVTYAELLGRENVIASADCGFSSRASYGPEVDAAVAWEKLRALAEGATLASHRLWRS
jgi:5-methyltetrahydropteroyltriglutamate--homocysteine methyltransferase